MMKFIIIFVSLFFVPWLISYILPALWLWLLDSIKAWLHRLRRHEPPVFDKYGVHIFCGRVGCGKTISMIRKAEQLKRKYPKLKIYSNFHCSISDAVIDSWEDIINLTNYDDKGVNQGVLFLFDELHLTLASQGWRNAPDNLLEYISLQRHLGKCIFGTTQVWSRVNKIIREQTDTVTECKCWLGKRYVTNKCYLQEDYLINGDQKDSGTRKRPTLYKDKFVSSDRLRSMYDTNEIIGSLSIGEIKNT